MIWEGQIFLKKGYKYSLTSGVEFSDPGKTPELDFKGFFFLVFLDPDCKILNPDSDPDPHIESDPQSLPIKILCFRLQLCVSTSFPR
jgi:hypothetical protein